MNSRRRAALFAIVSAFSMIFSGAGWSAQPTRIIVGFPAGNATDITARIMAQWLTERLGQQFIVENRPGAGGNIATEAVARAPADGRTLLLIAPSHAVNAALSRIAHRKTRVNALNLGYDFAPVASFVHQPNVMLVHPSVPARTVPEFIAHAKTNPGKISFASAGKGTSIHMATELFKVMVGVDLVHVPYRGGASALADLISGQVQLMFGSISTSVEAVASGGLRLLAVTTARRWESLPETPTIGEFVPGYEMSTWFGLGAPQGTPTGIIERLNLEINAALADPGIKAKLSDLGCAPLPGSSDEFRTLIATETEKWARVIDVAGVIPE
jgi:tripartite-type tricarboxylate transporter receptor subunit TctC